MEKKLLTTLILCAMNGAWAESSTNDTESLDDVIVTATRSEINVSEAPGSVTVISREEIVQKGGTNILDIIRGTPGVSLQGIGSGGRKSIILRGMESKHTLILVDGKRIPASNDAIGPNTNYQYDWIPTDNIERIEIVRGPMSVLYGTDALGGVVNIITRKPQKGLGGSVKLTSRLANDGSHNDGDGHDVEFNLNGSANDKLQFSVTGQQSRRASLASKQYLGESAIEGREKKQLSLGLDWQPSENHNIEFEYGTGKEDRWYVTNTDPIEHTGTLYQSSYDIDRQHISLGWKGSIGKTTSSLRAYQSKVDVTNSATNGETPTVPQKLTETTLDGNISFSTGEKQFITAGLEHRNEKLENSNLVTGKDDFTLNSLYVQDEIDLTENTLLTLGARLDNHEVFGNEISPRASIVWTATDKLTLKGSYGHGFRAPTIKQVAPGYVFSLPGFEIASNPNLEPETNDALELGANYSTDKFSINTALFDNKVKNLIVTSFDTISFDPIASVVVAHFSPKNIDEARLKGGELSTRISLSKNLNLNTSYQYLDAKNGAGERLESRPRHTLSAGVTWKKNNWKLNLNAEHLADQLIKPKESRVITEVPDYTIWNAGARKSLNKNLELAISIDNLTDIRLEDKSIAFNHEEYPRTLKLEVRGSF